MFNFLFKKRKKKTEKSKFDQEEACCPACSVHLDYFPTRERACPHCSQMILIRTRPNDSKRVLVTSNQAKKFEKEWDFKSALTKLVNVSPDEIEKHKLSYKKHVPSDNDVAWSLLNRKLNLAMKKGDFQEMASIYMDQATQLYYEGKKFHSVMALHHKMMLTFMKNIGVPTVEILTARNSECCPACIEMEAKKISVDEAIKASVLPVRACTVRPGKSGEGWCRCLYVTCANEL
jgi:DNA-directed RNA polymerase subunit RPC12/RpoP